MSALLVGYARCFTDAQDLTAQRDALATLSWLRSSTALLAATLFARRPLDRGRAH